ncbi:MAG: rhodanese-like domain-containing protein [Burkholderiales bacterium]
MPVRVALALALALCAVVPAAAKDAASLESVKTELRARFPDVRTLSTEDLRRWQGDAARPQPVLLDARTREEYAVSRLPGAALTPDVAAASRALAGRPMDVPVVVYCSVGYRSSVLARALGQRGYTNVVNLEGSLFEWANRGLPLESAAGDRQVHPYDARWGRYLERPAPAAPKP